MSKISFKNIILKAVIIMICLLTFGATLVNPVVIKNSPVYSCQKTASASLPSIKNIIKSLFKKDIKNNEPSRERVSVYLGGYPLGFTIKCSGVIVVAISNETASGLREGDIITKIEDIEVNSMEDISLLINSESFAGKVLSISYIRSGEENKTTIKPIFDEKLSVYKLGLWIRDDAAGVGTLTFIRKDNLRFGALGHPVCDIDTGNILRVKDGNIFRCNIVGYKSGVRGNPGELKGLFLRNGSILGSLDTNNKFGVYGNFSKKFISKFSDDEVEVAERKEVKCGKAQIRCTIDGVTPKLYDIEIVKTYFQSSKDNKSMFIRVVDKELLAKTGGIIQGMSGSPIIQNGKLVGAVTHVFVSDPTKGYGIYADWMIDN